MRNRQGCVGVKKELTRMSWWKRSTSRKQIQEDAGNNTEDRVIARRIAE